MAITQSRMLTLITIARDFQRVHEYLTSQIKAQILSPQSTDRAWLQRIHHEITAILTINPNHYANLLVEERHFKDQGRKNERNAEKMRKARAPLRGKPRKSRFPTPETIQPSFPLLAQAPLGSGTSSDEPSYTPTTFSQAEVAKIEALSKETQEVEDKKLQEESRAAAKAFLGL